MRRALLAATMLVGLVFGAPAVASAVTITFNSLAHGEVVDTDFSGGAFGVTITADNVGGGPDLAVAFDTTETGTADPDLEGPPNFNWNAGNLAPSTVLNVALIIQENSTGCGDDICDNPDDEGSRPAGDLIFDFNSVMTSFGFDIIDVEGAVENGKLTFQLGGVNLISVPFMNFVTNGKPFYDASVVFGNRTANRISPLTATALNAASSNVITGFNTVIVMLGGSGALDNITFIPEPGTMSLVAAGLLGLLAAARRAGPRR